MEKSTDTNNDYLKEIITEDAIEEMWYKELHEAKNMARSEAITTILLEKRDNLKDINITKNPLHQTEFTDDEQRRIDTYIENDPQVRKINDYYSSLLRKLKRESTLSQSSAKKL